jgi:O-antigen ligase
MPNHQNRIAWNFLQLGVFSLSLFPALGAIGILIAALMAIEKQGRSILRNPTLKKVTYLLTSIGIGLIITSYFAEQPQESWLGLANFLPYFILLPSVPSIVNTIQQLRRLAWLFIASSPIIVILGLGQLSDRWSFNTIFGWKLIAGGMPVGRMSSVFMNCNLLGLYLSICLALCLGLIIDNYRNKKYKTSQQYEGSLLFLIIILPIDLIGIFLTASRNIWAISISIVLTFALYLSWHYLVLFFVSIVGAIGWSAYGFGNSRDWLRNIIPMRIWDRLSGNIYTEMPTAYLRSNQWQFAFDSIQERPWLGWGLRSFSSLYQTETGFWLGHPHNLFLMFGMEMGLPIAIMFVGSIGWIVARGTILLWQQDRFDKKTTKADSERDIDREKSSIFIAYLISFFVCIFFNIVDVSLYDLRSNLAGWLLLAVITSIIIEFDRQKNLSNYP